MMYPDYSLEYYGRELRRERLREAEQFRLVKLATEQQSRLSTSKNRMSGLIVLLLKLGVIIILLPLAGYLAS